MRARVRVSFDRPYRLKDKESLESQIQGLTSLWRGWLGPDVDNLKIEIIWKEEREHDG